MDHCKPPVNLAEDLAGLPSSPVEGIVTMGKADHGKYCNTCIPPAFKLLFLILST